MHRYYIKAYGTLWTGHTWTTELHYARAYSLAGASDALDAARASCPAAYIIQLNGRVG